MIADHTKSAILAILAVDKGVTDAERGAIANVLAGYRIRPGRMLKVKDVADRLGLHVNTVRNYMKAGRIAFVKGLGGTAVGVSEDAVDDFLEGQNEEYE